MFYGRTHDGIIYSKVALQNFLAGFVRLKKNIRPYIRDTFNAVPVEITKIHRLNNNFFNAILVAAVFGVNGACGEMAKDVLCWSSFPLSKEQTRVAETTALSGDAFIIVCSNRLCLLRSSDFTWTVFFVGHPMQPRSWFHC